MTVVAITGASGFVGSALARRLESAGHEVLRCVRGQGPSAAGTIAWQPETGALDRTAAARAEVFVHLAGEPIAARRWTAATRQRIAESRGPTTARLCTTLAGLPRPPALLSASAVGIYGDRGDERLDERSAPGRGFLAEVTTAWEAAAEPLRTAGARVAHLRIGMVIGRGGALAKMLPVFRLGLGGRLGSGRQYVSWIAIDDLVAIAERLLQGGSGIFVCTAPEPVTNREFTATLTRALRRPAFLPAPALALRLAFGGLADAALLSSQRAVPARLQELGFRFRHEHLDSALRAAIGGTGPTG